MSEQEFDVLLTEDDYLFLEKEGLSEEEIEILRDASAIVETMNILPDDPNELFAKYNAIPTTTYGESVEYVMNLAKTDPKFFAQLMAVTDLVISGQEIDDVKFTPDPALANFSDEECEIAMKKLYSTLSTLPRDKHTELMGLLQKITPEQKTGLMKDLLK